MRYGRENVMKGKSYTGKKGQVVGKESGKDTSEREKSGKEGKVSKGKSQEWKKVKKGKGHEGNGSIWERSKRDWK
jgi:hypothetical protein